MPDLRDQLLVDEAKMRRDRLGAALIYGPQPERRTIVDNVKRIIISIVVAAIAAAVCVGVSFIGNFMAQQAAEKAKQQQIQQDLQQQQQDRLDELNQQNGTPNPEETP